MNPLLLLILAVLYALWPYDLLADLLPGWGWIDDILLLYLAWRYYRARRPGSGNRFEQQGGSSASNAGNGNRAASSEGAKDPHTVLSVSPDASPEEIQQAYRKLAALYHPDKVQHLGEDFRRLAELRFKEIQAAYEELKGRASK